MRIAYLVHLNWGPSSGVFKKVVGQLQAWQCARHDVKLFVITREHKVAQPLDGAAEVFMYSKISIRRRLQAYSEAVQAILKWQPEVVYTRQDRYYPQLASLASQCKVVIELNTDDLAEIWLYSKTKWLYHLLTRGLILRRASGLVFVSGELSQRWSYRCFRKPFLILGNGIGMDEIKPAMPLTTGKPRLIFIGQAGMLWHGVDKLIDLAAAFPDWRLDLVGLKPEQIEGKIPANIVFHGMLERSEYEQVLQQADCAIGTLALHRKHMDEASPLKTREYLAYGLPAIIGYRDTDFPQGADFLLQLPNTENNVRENFECIRQFILAWKGKRVPREAVEHLDYADKEARRLDFFESLLDPTLPGLCSESLQEKC